MQQIFFFLTVQQKKNYVRKKIAIYNISLVIFKFCAQKKTITIQFIYFNHFFNRVYTKVTKV